MTTDLTQPGTLSLIPGRPNPQGAAGARLFLLHGDATIPVTTIIPTPNQLLPPRRAISAAQPFHLKLLHFNDLHNHIARLSPQGNTPIFSRMVTRVKQFRARTGSDPDAATLLLSAGDDQGGAPFDELLGRTPASFSAHPGYRLSSAAGVDAATFGNHDFDMDVPLLAHAIRREVRFPLLSANLAGSHWLGRTYFPAAILVLKGVRVGIIGLTTPTRIRSYLDPELHATDPLAVVHHLLPTLRPLCDVLLILSHLGYGLAGNTDPLRQPGDIELAYSLPANGATLIVGGHTHTVLNEHHLEPDNVINGVPLVQAGAAGDFLGEVDIKITDRARVVAARLQPVADLPVDEPFEQEQVQPLVGQLWPRYTERLGQAIDQPDLIGAEVVSSFATGESALANFITDALVSRCRLHGNPVDIVMLDEANVNAGLPAGQPLTFGEWFAVMPYLDTLRIFHVTGRRLLVLLADNALRIDRPGEPVGRRGFLHFSRQVQYTIEPGADRINATATNITINGQPLNEQLDQPFIVAAGRFVRGLSGKWQEELLAHGFPLVDIQRWSYTSTNIYIRDELIAHIREMGAVSATRDGRLTVEPFASSDGSL
jgi:5'-nucleotidase/UDP-sugar diphosphatase